MTHFYKGTGHVNRAKSWRAGLDSPLQVFVQLFDHKLRLVGTGNPPNDSYLIYLSFCLATMDGIVTILFILIMFLISD